MKLTDDVITVFNKRLVAATKDYTWLPTTIEGVRWFATQAETVDPRGGLKMARKVVVRIPMDARIGGEKKYAAPRAYTSAENVSGLFTLNAGSVIVKGHVEGGSWTPDTLHAAFDDVTNVLSVVDNRGAPLEPHFRVVGD